MKISLQLTVVALVVGLLAPHAQAYEWERPLQVGDEGDDVTELQIRVAGWFPRLSRQLKLTGTFDKKTHNALVAFQKHYKLETDGVAGPSTFEALNSLEKEDGSTTNFAWTEFVQNRNSRCSAEANKHAGTFKGGMVPRAVVRNNVRRLMWRLEALRAKGGSNPVGINSGYRSVAYNKCIGGASLSQHMYGTAADLRMSKVDNRAARDIAKKNQFYGIGCYSQFSHNHLDLRLENSDLPQGQYWWWPRQDNKGRDLAQDNKPCWGETAQAGRMAGLALADVITAVADAIPGAGSLLPSPAEIEAFNNSHEHHLDGHAD
jgi:peptidoglycan hydrolase-like protein with peptidoglycan-binding domain